MNTIDIKLVISAILIFILNGNLQSQNKSNQKIEIANQHIQFINQLTDNLNVSQKCLYSLYFSLERSRKSESNNYIGSDYICSQFVNEDQFNNLLEKPEICYLVKLWK